MTELDQPAERQPRSPGRGSVVVAALVALALGVAGTLLVTRGNAPSVTDIGADAGFARDMQTHHQQAVEMAFLVRDRSEDEQVRGMALDIITSQQQQAGQMYGWLVQWGLPQTASRPAMAWVGGQHAAHSDTPGAMPGMATSEQLDTLRAADGVEAERVFLRLMIEHHRGGVDMAEAALADAETEEVRTLAGAITTAQTAEITVMEAMLADRG